MQRRKHFGTIYVQYKNHFATKCSVENILKLTTDHHHLFLDIDLDLCPIPPTQIQVARQIFPTSYRYENDLYLQYTEHQHEINQFPTHQLLMNQSQLEYYEFHLQLFPAHSLNLNIVISE